MVFILIILYALTVITIVLFLYIKVRALSENSDVLPRTHHERWLYHLIHELWRRGMRAFRRIINHAAVAIIKWWIHVVVTINRNLHKRFPDLSYLFGERVLVKHPDEVEASEFIREIRAHQIDMRDGRPQEALTEMKPEPVVRTPRIRRKKTTPISPTDSQNSNIE